MRLVELGKTGEKVPVIGQGTWGIGLFHAPEYYRQWKAALHKGIELGMTHLDTAEVYGFGKAESVVGEVVRDYPRDSLFLTSKLFPIHFSHSSMKKAAYATLDRMGLDHLDLYLLHWPSPIVSIERHMKALEELVKEGKTRYLGVSNFSVNQFIEAQHALKREELVTNQVLVNVTRQHHLHESLPYYQKEGITLTAYSPLGHRGLTNVKGSTRENLERIAASHNTTIQQVALAWLVNAERVIAIPKAFHTSHVEANAAAGDLNLTREEMSSLAEKSLSNPGKR